MNATAERLKNIRLFADLNDAIRERIASKCPPPRLYGGHVHLFHEGDPGGQLYMVLRGGVKIYTNTNGNGQETILDILFAGEFFGEMAFLTGGERTASAVTIAEETELLRMDQATFQSLLRETPELSFELIRLLALRLREMNLKLGDGSSSSLARVAKLLLARSDFQSGKLCPPLSQEEIASFINVRRETVARNLQKLESSLCLRRNRGHLIIIDRQHLERIAKTG